MIMHRIHRLLCTLNTSVHHLWRVTITLDDLSAQFDSRQCFPPRLDPKVTPPRCECALIARQRALLPPHLTDSKATTLIPKISKIPNAHMSMREDTRIELLPPWLHRFLA